MENEQNEIIIDSEQNNEEQVEEVVEEQEEVKVQEKPQESDEAKKARLERQLKKVNKRLGVEEKVEEQSKDDGLSQKDVLILAKADVHQDDLEDVIEYAQFKKIPISQALEDRTLKAIIKDKAEIRKTAEATNTKPQKRSVSEVDDSQIIKQSLEGKIPERGSKEAEQLFWAKRNRERGK